MQGTAATNIFLTPEEQQRFDSLSPITRDQQMVIDNIAKILLDSIRGKNE